MTSTVPRQPGRAELEHPSWCDMPNCPLVLMAVGGLHQSREIPVHDDDGRKVAGVVLRQAAAGRLRVEVGGRTQGLSPHTARRFGLALQEAAGWADAEQQP